MVNFLNESGLQKFWTKIVNKFVAKEDGKGLSSNDYTTTEKNKLAGIAEGANNYTLPAATAGSLGGVKVGAGLAVTEDGTLSATGGGTADAVEWDNVLNKPEAFPPETHSHSEYLQLAGGVMTGNINMSGTSKVTGLATPSDANDAATKNYVDTSVSNKANKATTLSGYGIGDAYTKNEVDSKISATFKYAGTVDFAGLPASTSGLTGNVYNISEPFVTDARFVEGAGKSYPMGTNVAVTTDGKFDILTGFIDLSGYVLSSALVPISDEQIDEITTL